jgi:hypothetical protein
MSEPLRGEVVDGERISVSDRPTGANFDELFELFKSAFDVVGITLLYTICFGESPGFGAATDVPNAILTLFDRAEKIRRWRALLETAKTRVKASDRPDLHKKCDDVLAYLEPTTIATAAAAHDEILLGRVPFVDRKPIRRAVVEMSQNGLPGIFVSGPMHVGKSHCEELLKHFAHGRQDRVTGVDFRRDFSRVPSPLEVARRLLLRGNVPPVAGLDTYQTDDRSIGELAAEIAMHLEIKHAGVLVWIVLHGFNHETVTKALHDFIVGLAVEVRRRRNLRLMLLGYKPSTYPELEPHFDLVPLSCLTPEELVEFFDELEKRFAFKTRAASAAAARARDDWLASVRSLDQEVRALRIKDGLLGIVRDLVRTANGGGNP